ncbi:MAG: MFS transporter [Oscillospiraceae bacterium]|nr:MFS transporter [Oscillospiraceae bacterium]
MAKEYLKGSMFDRDQWQTRVKTNRITTKERLLGHIIGPGLVYFFYSTLLGLRELFYMDVLRINEVFNNPYTYLIMTTVTMIIGMGTGFFFNHMTEKTVCRAGRFRPYVLIGTWIMAIAGFFVFWSPFARGSVMQLVWLYLFNILFTAVGLPLWNFRSNVVSTISRNVLERNNVTTIRSAVTVMIAGTLGALGIIGFLYPNVLQKDLSGTSWYITIGVCAVIALGFSFMEYFWTRERVTEDNQKVLADTSGDSAINVPFKQQFKNLIVNKYFLLAMAVFIGVAFYDNLQGGNARVNMITYILGGNAQNNYQFTYLLASMQPMAIGAVLVPILAKRISSRKIMMVSSVIALAGIAIAMINPYSFLVAVAGGFVFACGIFAITNMNGVFMQQASDDIEYKHGYRPEGTLAVGIITTVISAIMTPLNAVYETGLTLNGYVAGAVQQPQAVNNWILFAYYGAYAVLAVVIFVVCIFFDMEKKLPAVHAELRERARKAAEDRGEVYVSPEEQDQLEMEAATRELEADRVADLKEKCAKKGLDFETENRKYLDAQAAKKAKLEAKLAKKKK